MPPKQKPTMPMFVGVHVRVAAQVVYRRLHVGVDVLHGQLAPLGERALHVRERNLRARAGAVEQLGRSGEVALGGKAINDALHVVVDAEYLLNHDDCRALPVAIRTCRMNRHRGSPSADFRNFLYCHALPPRIHKIFKVGAFARPTSTAASRAPRQRTDANRKPITTPAPWKATAPSRA